MLISQLPENIKEIALSLQKESEDNVNAWDRQSDDLFDAFDWEDSPQGDIFWNQCYNAEQAEDLPTL